LEQLTIVMARGVQSRLESSDLEHVLLNAHSLQELHLIEVDCFTDDVLVAALSMHGFPALKQVHQSECSVIFQDVKH
jgi:hypothetical protein